MHQLLILLRLYFPPIVLALPSALCNTTFSWCIYLFIFSFSGKPSKDPVHPNHVKQLYSHSPDHVRERLQAALGRYNSSQDRYNTEFMSQMKLPSALGAADSGPMVSVVCNQPMEPGPIVLSTPE